MEPGKPPKRKTPLKRSMKPLKRTPLKRTEHPRPKRSETDEERRERNRRRTEYQNAPAKGLEDGITLQEGLRIVRERASGRCEVMASAECTGVHEATHHRKSRRFRDHRPRNLVATCDNCHTQAEDSIHRNPLRAHEHGWLVWSYEDPRVVPIDPPIRGW